MGDNGAAEGNAEEMSEERKERQAGTAAINEGTERKMVYITGLQDEYQELVKQGKLGESMIKDLERRQIIENDACSAQDVQHDTDRQVLLIDQAVSAAANAAATEARKASVIACQNGKTALLVQISPSGGGVPPSAAGPSGSADDVVGKKRCKH